MNIISIKSISALGITLVFQIYFQEQVVDKIRNLKLHSEVDADRVHMKNLLMVFLFLIPASFSMTQKETRRLNMYIISFCQFSKNLTLFRTHI